MDNLLMQFKNDNGVTYKTMAREINKILAKTCNIKVCRESVEDYAKSKKILPRYQEVSQAIAEYIGTSVKDLLASMRACKKEN